MSMSEFDVMDTMPVPVEEDVFNKHYVEIAGAIAAIVFAVVILYILFKTGKIGTGTEVGAGTGTK